MKFSKPVYDATSKVYRSDVLDGPSFRSEFDLEGNVWTPSLDTFLESQKASLIQQTLEATKGWFTKPLTQDWLSNRMQLILPDELPPAFEGTAEWTIKTLLISKEAFIFQGELVRAVQKERIELMDDSTQHHDEEFLEEVEFNPPAASQEPLSLGPTRRMVAKQAVLEARDRAARALFRANELTREYCNLYGDDTDWEDEFDSDSD